MTSTHKLLGAGLVLIGLAIIYLYSGDYTSRYLFKCLTQTCSYTDVGARPWKETQVILPTLMFWSGILLTAAGLFGLAINSTNPKEQE